MPVPEINRDIYQEIIYRLVKKHKISDLEIERIVDSQFKAVLEIINEKGSKVVSIKHLGKFLPTTHRQKKLKANENKGIENSTDN
jgi:nucleoid DNA-binding protein